MLTSNKLAGVSISGYHKGHAGQRGHEIRRRGGRTSAAAKKLVAADSTYVPKPGESPNSSAAALSRMLMAYEQSLKKKRGKK